MKELSQPIINTLQELRAINFQLEELKTKDTDLRKDLLGRMENEGLTDGFSTDDATVSYVNRKSVKIVDKTKMLDTLIEKNCVRYFAYDFTPAFEKDIKEGKLKPESGLFTDGDVRIETNNNISIRFK